MASLWPLLGTPAAHCSKFFSELSQRQLLTVSLSCGAALRADIEASVGLSPPFPTLLPIHLLLPINSRPLPNLANHAPPPPSPDAAIHARQPRKQRLRPRR